MFLYEQLFVSFTEEQNCLNTDGSIIHILSFKIFFEVSSKLLRCSIFCKSEFSFLDKNIELLSLHLKIGATNTIPPTPNSKSFHLGQINTKLFI